MTRRCLALLVLPILAALALVVLPAAIAAPPAPSNAFAITNVRVFDGADLIPKAVVVVRNGTIEAMGPQVKVPPGAEVVDGGGGTLLPGFIDAHTHAFTESLRRALVFGVTTELDMFTDPGFARSARAEQAAPGGVADRADLFSAGSLATVPHGHGTEYGLPAPPITRPEDAQAWVDDRLAEGSDYIKIVDETGATFNMKIPTLSPPTIAALIRAAHRRGKLAVVHISSQVSALRAIESGADGLVHLFADSPPDADFIRSAAKHKAFVIPTLTVLQSTTASGMASGKGLATDPRLRDYLTPGEVANLNEWAKGNGELKYAFETVRRLRDAGVPVLAGTDAPNPGTAHGVSIHREMELLVEAGMTPQQALAAATSVPARAFRLKDRGRIAPGLRADLVLVAGDPLRDITATRAIVRLWKGGKPVARPRMAEPNTAAP
jgi:imidazolonepropionase-like amidohydrolase